MAQVTILRRSRALSSPTPGELKDVVEVTYSTLAIPPRQVHLPLDLYRPATADELAANARYQMLPVDGKATGVELEAISADLKSAAAGAAETVDVP